MKQIRKNNLIVDAIIPNTIFQYLPFKDEPISEWNVNLDVVTFSTLLFKGTGYEDYGLHHFETELLNIKELTRAFDEKIEKFNRRRSKEYKITVSSFLDNSKFGLLSKYLIAWKAVISNILSESCFFSIIYFLESEQDLDSSLLLIGNFYYKQGYQALRNFVESMVLLTHFTENESDFLAWKKSSFYTPRLRGKKGLLINLLDKGIIPLNLTNEITTIYAELNAYVHGNVDKLLHKGIFNNTWRGYTFKEDDFNQYADMFCKAITIGLQLVRINIAQWEIKYSKLIRCSICHSNNFKVEKEIVGKKIVNHYRCLQCNSEMALAEGFPHVDLQEGL